MTNYIDGWKELHPVTCFGDLAIPTVFGEELSYYEKLCRVTEELNRVLHNVDLLHEEYVFLEGMYKTLKDYVDNYFNNLDVQEEINNKLDEMVESGDFDSVLNKLFTGYSPLFPASMGCNGNGWLNPSGTSFSTARYNYSMNGVIAMKNDVDDMKEVGAKELCYQVVYVYDSGGATLYEQAKYIGDLKELHSYCENINMNDDTLAVHVIKNGVRHWLFSDNEVDSYIELTSWILQQLPFIKRVDFLVECDEMYQPNQGSTKIINFLHQNNLKVGVSPRTDSGVYTISKEIMNIIDYVSLHVYTPLRYFDYSVININRDIDYLSQFWDGILKYIPDNKEIVVGETGCRDYKNMLMTPSSSTIEGIGSITNGMIPAYYYSVVYEVFKDKASRIYNWWMDGFTYPNNTKNNVKNLIQKWRKVL